MKILETIGSNWRFIKGKLDRIFQRSFDFNVYFDFVWCKRNCSVLNSLRIWEYVNAIFVTLKTAIMKFTQIPSTNSKEFSLLYKQSGNLSVFFCTFHWNHNETGLCVLDKLLIAVLWIFVNIHHKLPINRLFKRWKLSHLWVKMISEWAFIGLFSHFA